MEYGKTTTKPTKPGKASPGGGDKSMPEKAVGYHQWTCSVCGDTSITICTVYLGNYDHCQVCEVVGYRFV